MTLVSVLASLFTTLAYITAAVLAITAILVLVEARNKRRRAARAAREAQRRRWAEMCAIAKLMQEQRDETFQRAVWFERTERLEDVI